jgi:hypothetical protein
MSSALCFADLAIPTSMPTDDFNSFTLMSQCQPDQADEDHFAMSQ